ncbi:hypothetical protein GOQ30_05170 [Flavobacterium sp. TP390]|uniref:DNA-directed RNA polymerase n=1 Tax=Flavobacterium profundi TaxID=1774945 RepID=A0A6I4IKE8_9FLAO|nr:hypothetical protein [Flavobacterium profundi]MVO08551.1 hypothetical protein [Flavobacterium profundi]
MLRNISTLVTPLNHNRSETQPRPVSVTQAEDNEEPKKLTLYIPSNLDIDEILKVTPPNFKFHRDYFIYLLHLVTDIPSRNKDVEMVYVPFYSALIQRRVRDYRNYLDYMVNNSILIENHQYVVGKSSRSFRFSSKFQTPVKPVFITKPTLIKSILKFIKLDDSNNQTDLVINHIDDKDLDYLLKWFNEKLIVNYKEAKQYLEQLYEREKNDFLIGSNAMQRFNSRYLVLLKLQRKDFTYSVDSTAGRLHTILTQIKSDLRQFIKYDNKNLVAIDITNSQPYLSTVLFNKKKVEENEIIKTIKLYNKSFITQDKFNSLPYYVSKNAENAYLSENVNQYIEIVKSGQLYEEFGRILLMKGIIKDDSPVRNQAKKIIFSAIFSPNQSISYNSAIKIFKDNFPDVYEIYRLIKQNEHRTLACLLQNIEAKLVLHTACKIISEEKPEIPIFTLHDSIITTEGNENYVYQILYDVLLNAIGIPPTLKLENWKKVA